MASKSHVDAIAALTAEEAAKVLHTLLKRHPELHDEAAAIAAGTLGDVTYQDVADEVESEVLQFDDDDLYSRAGARSHGYVGPDEAAQELLEEAVQPFNDKIKRCLQAGMEEQAEELCKGIILGLYRVRDDVENDVLREAEGFAPDAAGAAFDVWSGTGIALGKSKRKLPREFILNHAPEWASFLLKKRG